MDGLLRVANKRPNSSLRRAAARGVTHGRSSLISEVEEDGNDHAVEQGQDVMQPALTSSPASSFASLCAICRLRQSPYTCPQCNVQYCSMECFRASKHRSCAEAFQRQTLRSELGSDHNGNNKPNEGPRVDEEERKRMMDVLRRMRRLGEDDEGGDEEEAEGEGENDNDNAIDASQQARKVSERLGVDIESADTQELWSMLSLEQRKEFERLVLTASNEKGRSISSRTAKLLQLDNLTGKEPWWTRAENESESEIIDKGEFSQAVRKISQSMCKEQTADLRWNVVAVATAYVYAVRRLGVRSLGALDKDDRSFAKDNFERLLPFLLPSSSSLFSDIEEVTLWTVAKTDMQENSAKTMVYLLRDMLQLVCKAHVVSIESCNNVTLLLSDLQSFLPKHGRKKVVFYAAYWSLLTTSELDEITEAVEAEIKRLEGELERAEDEERFFAANEALQQRDKITLS